MRIIYAFLVLFFFQTSDLFCPLLPEMLENILDLYGKERYLRLCKTSCGDCKYCRQINTLYLNPQYSVGGIRDSINKKKEEYLEYYRQLLQLETSDALLCSFDIAVTEWSNKCYKNRKINLTIEDYTECMMMLLIHSNAKLYHSENPEDKARNWLCIDLHYLNVSFVIEFVLSFLEIMQEKWDKDSENQLCPAVFFITGRGNHSNKLDKTKQTPTHINFSLYQAVKRHCSILINKHVQK